MKIKMNMNRGEKPYRQSHIGHTKKLFEGIPVPEGAGKLVHISNGGYPTYGLMFGFRVFFNQDTGEFHRQVISEAAFKAWKAKACDEACIRQKGNTSLESVINAILYREYIARETLARMNNTAEGCAV